jgi:pimeloyl-ACP methyl ester carboxylesterase
MLIPELMSRWQVIALDQRGHGLSQRQGPYRVVDYARDAVEFVESLSDSVTVLGHSLGAMVALWVGANCPQKIRGLILEDPPFETMGSAIHGTAFQAQFSGMQAVARNGGSVDELIDGLAHIMLPGPNGPIRFGSIRDRASLQFSAECLAQLDPEIFTPLIEGTWLEGFDYRSLWSKVTAPITLLQGDPKAGGTLTDEEVQLARGDAPQLRHRFFPGIGHQIHRSAPKAVLEEVDKIRE